MIRKAFFTSLALFLVGAVYGSLYLPVSQLGKIDIHRAVSIYLFRDQDVNWLWFSFCALILIGIIFRTGVRSDFVHRVSLLLTSKKVPWVMALLCFGISGVGSYFIGMDYPFSLDEYFVQFQGKIFLAGDIAAKVPDDFQSLRPALQPYFTYRFEESGYWLSHYRPVFSLLWALFEFVGIGALTNSILSALSVVLIYSIAKVMWPTKPLLCGLCSVLLALSPHVVFPSMTTFAWPAYLFFNMLWLRCILSRNPIVNALGLLFGFFAVGLHQVHAHILFVAPFFFWVLFQRRFYLALGMVLVYVVALIFFIHWHELVAWYSLGVGWSDLGIFLDSEYISNYFESRNLFGDIERKAKYLFLSSNSFRFIAWLGLPLVFLGGCCVFVRNRWNVFWVCCVCAILITFLFHILVMPNQMHGWGFRYMQGVLGLVVLLAVFAFDALSEEADDVNAKNGSGLLQLVIVLLVTGSIFAYPLRAYQMSSYVRSKEAAWKYINSLNYDIVMLDTFGVYFGPDLVRNDPYLRSRPVVITYRALNYEQKLHLCSQYKTVVVSLDELMQFNLPFYINPLDPSYNVYRKRVLEEGNKGCDVLKGALKVVH